MPEQIFYERLRMQHPCYAKESTAVLADYNRQSVSTGNVNRASGNEARSAPHLMPDNRDLDALFSSLIANIGRIAEIR